MFWAVRQLVSLDSSATWPTSVFTCLLFTCPVRSVCRVQAHATNPPKLPFAKHRPPIPRSYRSYLPFGSLGTFRKPAVVESKFSSPVPRVTPCSVLSQTEGCLFPITARTLLSRLLQLQAAAHIKSVILRCLQEVKSFGVVLTRMPLHEACVDWT